MSTQKAARLGDVIELQDLASGEITAFCLCNTGEEDHPAGTRCLSREAPLAKASFGMTAGRRIEHSPPKGKARRFALLRVVPKGDYQPA